MYNSWGVDLSASVKALAEIKDTVLPLLISGKIHSIENLKDEILILLDQKSGIDYIRENEEGLQGVAARVQWGKSWETFTIRKERHTGAKTEYIKRMQQIKNGYFYPCFTLQAYFDSRETNNLLSVAVIKTVELYNFIEQNADSVYEKKSDNKFIYVKWCDVSDMIKKYPKLEPLPTLPYEPIEIIRTLPNQYQLDF